MGFEPILYRKPGGKFKLGYFTSFSIKTKLIIRYPSNCKLLLIIITISFQYFLPTKFFIEKVHSKLYIGSYF